MKKRITLCITATVLIAAASVCTSVFAQSRVPQSGNAQPKAVDLGLSVKWADRNLGASSPTGYGDYYAWGETSTKSEYTWETYKWSRGEDDNLKLTKYNVKSDRGTVDGKTQLDPTDDVAHSRLGGKWRLPTKKELNELHNQCDWTPTTSSGVKGYKVTGPNGNSIFLPYAGYRLNTYLDEVGSLGVYWCSSLYTDRPLDAWHLDFNSRGVLRNYWDARAYGFSVRPVSE